MNDLTGSFWPTAAVGERRLPARSGSWRQPYPTDDTRLITQAALAGLDKLYRPGFAFSKAEVLLMDLCGRGEFTDDLFASSQPANSEKVMAVLDSISAKWGRGTLRPGVVPAAPAWSMRRELMSLSFTTRVDQLWRVSAR